MARMSGTIRPPVGQQWVGMIHNRAGKVAQVLGPFDTYTEAVTWVNRAPKGLAPSIMPLGGVG